VRRISLGSSLARAAWTGVMNLATDIRERGDFSSLMRACTFNLNQLFRERL